ncbi:NAD-glutamate dehydrogenase [Nocardioides insulae]|uniref:NAD-glutamate dehydrogenase n=1 Tax=Nocardioides insulae TaxID=394734 RepID=UPI001FE0F247|nr:NAD-glutamate dehydrogenase [Nocardioides insulae]
MAAYYRHVAPEDLEDRTAGDLYGAFASHLRLAQTRPQGTASVRVETPTPGDHGWSAGSHSVVEIVVDDMPFLVDSVSMELSRQLREVHLVIHPGFDVERDVAGALVAMHAVEDGSREPAEGLVRESWMHVEIDRLAEADEDALVGDLLRVLRDVREAVEDWDKMADRLDGIVADLRSDPPSSVDAEELRQSTDLLEWLADDHFTFLGFREYDLVGEPGQEALRAHAGSGLGILRADPDLSASGRLPEPVRVKAREQKLLVLAKANSRATVHRPAYLDYVGVKRFDERGEVVGERRFLGLFSSAAYTESLHRIPLLREKVAAVLEYSRFDPASHAGKMLIDTLESYPRDELFHTPVDELAPMAEAAMEARERRRLRILVRNDTYGRYVSVLVTLPRDRYSTQVRERFSRILTEQLHAEDIEFTVRISESTTARVHFVVHVPDSELLEGRLPEVDLVDLERRFQEASRSWRDDLAAALDAEFGEQVGARLGRRYLDAFPEGYKEDYGARTGASDLGRVARLEEGGGGIDLLLLQTPDAGPGEFRLKVFRVGEPLSLSEVLPILACTGVEVTDERPYELLVGDVREQRRCFIYDFGLRYDQSDPGVGIDVESDHARTLFTDTVRALWQGAAEVDGFNALVMGAGLPWRQVAVLRAYAKFMRQGGTPFTLSTIEASLLGNVALTRLLVQLFEARFDPDLADLAGPREAASAQERERRVEDLIGRIAEALDAVASLDHDRVLRSYLTHIRATLRTNYYRDRPSISIKLDPTAIPDLPEPRPEYEIFVYSPRVEGVHLRFGKIARGGLRWSDRRDDFRTEVLGLVKAQMVKNTVIVPVGAKGGFVPKQLPPVGDREAWLAEGRACYRLFISSLLDLTDNRVDDGGERRVVPPPRVVRHDGDDPYLVVAADKGTATFSDLANEVSAEYDFWLGDAFASGGSVGYDHKAMGITARGAWVSVQRHFRERGLDCQRDDFTVVGVGDMSGDVFGNGMLLSEHIGLVAAFDHRDIFLDPTPDPAVSFAERSRLFDLPRSSWQDYDRGLISEGGGIWSRTLKAIPVSPQMRTALGLEEDVVLLPPNELIRAILRAPVDLLWNGGIGTYVKASEETHASVGDKTNDAVRVDGRDVRATIIGEGGNLGLTQAGRVEYAGLGADGAGGRINTDFIDNSAGVDTSDREVNLKILLDRVVAAGDLTLKQRNALLATMTDEVATLVLRDNEEQNLALASAVAHAPSLLHVHEEWMRRLEGRGVLNREVEGLPSRKEVRRRLEAGGVLTVPELAVLMAWTKIELARELEATDLPDDPSFRDELVDYFPAEIRERFTEQIVAHPLSRDIVVTQVVNDLVDRAGMTFWPRLTMESGASTAQLTRANFVARRVYGSAPLLAEVRALDHQVDASVQTRIRIEMRTLVERATRWLVTQQHPVDDDPTFGAFVAPVLQTLAALPDLLTGRELEAMLAREARLVKAGVPEKLATRVATLDPSYALLGIVDTALRDGLEPDEVARVHFALGERLGLPAILDRIVALPRTDNWTTMARAAIRDDLYSVHAQLTAQVLAHTASEDSAPARIATWEDQEAMQVGRAAETLQQICADGESDLARLSVGVRAVRGLLD